MGNVVDRSKREEVLVELSVVVVDGKLTFEVEGDAIDDMVGTGSLIDFHQIGGDPVLREGGAIQGHKGGSTAGAQVRDTEAPDGCVGAGGHLMVHHHLSFFLPATANYAMP